ncbi:MAG: hypothetical protein OXH15_05105 [Gammaproteobacteria bacterium]|nr:hypothetical protein [Gammaproteobacteria bacterium]
MPTIKLTRRQLKTAQRLLAEVMDSDGSGEDSDGKKTGTRKPDRKKAEQQQKALEESLPIPVE